MGFMGILGDLIWDFYRILYGFHGILDGVMETGKITGFGEFQWEYHGNNRIYHQP